MKGHLWRGLDPISRQGVQFLYRARHEYRVIQEIKKTIQHTMIELGSWRSMVSGVRH